MHPKKNPSSFIEHLSYWYDVTQAEETVDSFAYDINTTREILTNGINKSNHGKILRTFQNLNFHIPDTESKFMYLKEAHSKLYVDQVEKYICDILMIYAIPELIDPKTSLLKSELINFFNVDFSKKSEDEKKQITEYIVKAYLFYFLSRMNDVESINVPEVQNELVTIDNIEKIIKFREFLKFDTTLGYSLFEYADKLIKDYVDRSYILKDTDDLNLYKNSPHLDLMHDFLNKYPQIREQLQENKLYYQMLGKKYGEAFETLLSMPDSKPSLKKR